METFSSQSVEVQANTSSAVSIFVLCRYYDMLRDATHVSFSPFRCHLQRLLASPRLPSRTLAT